MISAEKLHEHATTPPLPPPAPHTASELDGMKATERSAYAQLVRRRLRSAPVHSPMHERVIERMSSALHSALMEPPGARTMIGLSAPFTCGKTTAITAWIQALYREWTGAQAGDPRPTLQPRPLCTVDHTPICYLSLQASTGSKDLYAQIVSFLGFKMRSRKPERDLADLAAESFDNLGVRLLVIDDAHMLKTDLKKGRETLDAVKHINSTLGALGGAIVLVGADLDASGMLADPQITGRLRMHRIRPYASQTDVERRAWQDFLRSCEARILPYLPGAERGLLANQLGSYLWMRTQGYVGQAWTLIVDGTSEAVRDATPLTRHTLDRIELSELTTREFDRLASMGQPTTARRTRRTKSRS